MTQIVTTADQTSNDTVLADLLADLGDDTILETVGEEGVAALSTQLIEVLDESVGDIGTIVAGEAAVEQFGAALKEGMGQIAIAAPADALPDTLLDEVADAVHADDARKEHYAKQGENMKTIVDATPPETTPEAVEEAGKKRGKRKGGKKATSVPAGYGADAEGTPAATPPADAAPAEPKPPKAPRATLVTHKPGDLLLVQLGNSAPDFLVFDSRHSLEEIDSAREAFVARMNERDAIADKVRLKIMMLLNWLHKGGDLNEVLKRTFTVLAKEGKLTSGDKGNLQVNLLAKPYSMGTARSQANQMFMALPELQITKKDKGVMVPNEHSALLMAINAKLGLPA